MESEGENLTFKRQRLTPRVIQDLKQRSFTGIGFYIIAICVVLFSDGYHLRYPAFSKQFLILVMAICLFRLVHRLSDKWIPERLQKANLAVFMGSIALTGLVWGSGFAEFLLQKGEPQSQILMVVCTIGLCSGGVVAYIPSLWLAIVFNFFILGPAIILMLAHQTNLSLNALVILFSIYMVFMALRGNKEYWNALENESLLEEKTKDLERISQKDGLTGLFNRRYFNGVFEFEWKRGVRSQTRVAMILCDIDCFKEVNDTFGHLAGDEFLKRVAQILQEVFKRKTDIVARYGGEEFMVLMPEESLENAVSLAEKIRGKVEESRLAFESHTIQATVSLGVAAMLPGLSQEKETLVSRADEALYAAKKNGRNQVIAHGV